MTERLSSLHDPYNGCVDLQHNYSDNQDWWLFISGIPGLIACQWGVAARNGEQKKKTTTTEKRERKREKSERTRSPHPGLKLFSPAHFSSRRPHYLNAKPVWQAFAGEGKGARHTRREVTLPPSSRAPQVSLVPWIPFTFPFERLPRRLQDAWKRLKVWKRGFDP